MPLRAFAIALLIGCGYTPHSFVATRRILDSAPFHSERQSLGCIDLAMTTRAEPRVSGTIVEYQLGNGCDRDVVVDFSTIHAIGHDTKGEAHELSAYDPNSELGVTTVDARQSFDVAIEYRAADPITSVCVDVGRVVPEVRSDRTWLCAPAAQLPAASHRRHCDGPVAVGYCEHYGYFHTPAYAAIELGAARFEIPDHAVIPAGIARTTAGVVSPSYLGGELRIVGGGGPIYGGFGPVIAMAPGGHAESVQLFAGLKLPMGPLELASEFAYGSRLVWIGDRGTRLPSYRASASAALWLGPSITLGVRAGRELDDAADMNVGVFVGLHCVPYDGHRGR